MLELLKKGLKEVNCDGKRQVQVWFTKELKELRKKMHRKDKGWLEGKATAEAKHLHEERVLERQSRVLQDSKKCKEVSS